MVIAELDKLKIFGNNSQERLEKALANLQNGNGVILIDDEDRKEYNAADKQGKSKILRDKKYSPLNNDIAMDIQSVISHLEQIAPLSYQESYDNAGLITGDPSWKIKGCESLKMFHKNCPIKSHQMMFMRTLM